MLGSEDHLRPCARMCVCVCVCVCVWVWVCAACAHMLLVAVVGRPLPLLPLLLHVCDIGGCCCVLCSAGGRVSQVHRCLTPVLHALLLCVGVNAAWCLSQTSRTVQSCAATSLYHDSASPAAGPGLSGSHDNRGGSGEGYCQSYSLGYGWLGWCPEPVSHAVRNGRVSPLPQRLSLLRQPALRAPME